MYAISFSGTPIFINFNFKSSYTLNDPSFLGVDKSQSNNERLVINFKDFRTIALDWNSLRNKGYTTAYGSVDDAYNYLEQQYYEAFEKHMYEIIKEDLYIYQCNYFGFDDITLDEIYFQFE